jgi:acetyl esterase/lipase
MESSPPAPYTTGYKFGNRANSLFDHPLSGQFDPQNLAAYNLTIQNPKPPNASIQHWRTLAATSSEGFLANPHRDHYNSHTSKETIHFEASQYSLDNNPRQIKLNIHRKLSSKHTKNAPAILYFHGGGVVI